MKDFIKEIHFRTMVYTDWTFWYVESDRECRYGLAIRTVSRFLLSTFLLPEVIYGWDRRSVNFNLWSHECEQFSAEFMSCFTYQYFLRVFTQSD